MKPEFTIDGLSIQTFEEVFEALVAKYKEVYGSDIDLSQNTPDGQKVGIEAEALYDLQEFAAKLYNYFDPDFSDGLMLDKIAKLCGVTRRPATRSSVTTTIVTDRNVTLPVGYTVADSNGQNWLTTSEYSLTTGSNTVTMYAELWGKIEALADTIISPVSVILGVTSITNPAAAIAGVDGETIPEFRIRRNKSLENASYSTIGGLYAKLAALSGVTKLRVYENPEDVYDAALDLDPHTIWCVLEGGDNATIAETIAKNRSGGVDTKGSVTATWVEELTKPNGDAFNFSHIMNFDRPTEVPLYVALTVTRKDPAQPVDLDLIKEKLAEKEYDLNTSAQANELYAYVYQAGTNFIATSLEISDDDITYTAGQLTNGYDELFTISAVNIDITEVIP